MVAVENCIQPIYKVGHGVHARPSVHNWCTQPAMLCVCIYVVKWRPSKTACTVKTVEIRQNTGFLHMPRVQADAYRHFQRNGVHISSRIWVFAKPGLRNRQIRESRDTQPTNSFRPDRHAADVTRFAHWSVAQNRARPLAEPTLRDRTLLDISKGVNLISLIRLLINNL